MTDDRSAARLAVLRATLLLDSAPERAFDRMTRLASKLLGAPMALVSLVDEDRQFFKSAVGLAEPWASRRETPLSHSFCKHVVEDRAPLIVEDARNHPVLRDNLAVRDLDVIAYAGIPLMVKGDAIGALCVLDRRPRAWSPEQLELLEGLAEGVVAEIDLRAAVRREREQRALTEALLEGLGDAVLAVDPSRKFLVVNGAARRVFTESAAPGKALDANWSAIHRSHATDGSPMPLEEGPLARGLAGEDTNDLTFTLQRPGAAAPVWVEARGRPVRDVDGQVIAAVGVYHEITAERALAASLDRAEQISRAIVQHLPNGGVLVLDRDFRYVSAEGPVIADVLRLSKLDRIVGRLFDEVTTPQNLDKMRAMYERVFAGERQRFEVSRDGRRFEANAVPVFGESEVSHALLFLYDVTDREREADELRRARDVIAEEHALFDETVANIEDGLVVLDGEGRALVVNDAFLSMFGVTRVRMMEQGRDAFLDEVVAPMLDPEELERLRGSRAAAEDFVFKRPQRRVLQRRCTVFHSSQKLLVLWRDVTAERDSMSARERLLLIDALTGIANRRAAEETLAIEESRARRSGAPLCVALFDIDHFKKLNDTYGHAVGDEVLRAVATAVAGQARLTDTVARWGGEEFLAVLPVPLEGARRFCERARRAVEAIRHEKVREVTISVGVAELGPEEVTAAAIERADRWLYAAKESGRNRVRWE